jgi:DnaJ like chaperone protein
MIGVMSIWTRIAEALSALAQGEGLSVVFERLRGAPELSVGFTIAVIALGAKMAKADGEVTRDEVAAFRSVFAIAPGEEANAAQVFNLARQDVAGFEIYARKIRAMFRGNHEETLGDLLDGLFQIALADGRYHPREDEFLGRVALAFELPERTFRAIRARFVEGQARDPYEVLGVAADAPLDEVRAAWKQAVRDSHPDAMVARGMPAEAVNLAQARMIAINAAWDEITARRAA